MPRVRFLNAAEVSRAHHGLYLPALSLLSVWLRLSLMTIRRCGLSIPMVLRRLLESISWESIRGVDLSMAAQCVCRPSSYVQASRTRLRLPSPAQSLREPLQGVKAVCPVSEELAVWIKSPRAAIADLMHAYDLSADNWPDGMRVINLPGLTVTVAEMVTALERAGGDKKLISWEHDSTIESIVATWPQGMITERASALGFEADESIDVVIQQFLTDELGQTS